MDPVDDTLSTLAETQHGLVARWQSDALGIDRRAWRHRLARGGWQSLTVRVARRSGSARTDDQRALAACLDAGPDTYVSHQSAAALWSVPGFRLDPIQVMTLRGRHVRSALAAVHRPLHLPAPFAAIIDGVPLVRPSLLLLQLAPVVHPDRLDRIFDGMWARRLLSAPSVRRELDGSWDEVEVVPSRCARSSIASRLATCRLPVTLRPASPRSCAITAWPRCGASWTPETRFAGAVASTSWPTTCRSWSR